MAAGSSSRTIKPTEGEARLISAIIAGPRERSSAARERTSRVHARFGARFDTFEGLRFAFALENCRFCRVEFGEHIGVGHLRKLHLRTARSASSARKSIPLGDSGTGKSHTLVNDWARPATTNASAALRHTTSARGDRSPPRIASSAAAFAGGVAATQLVERGVHAVVARDQASSRAPRMQSNCIIRVGPSPAISSKPLLRMDDRAGFGTQFP